MQRVTVGLFVVAALGGALALGGCAGRRGGTCSAPPPAPPSVHERGAEPPTALPAVDFARHLGDGGCFVVRDAATGERTESDAERCAARRRPYSTFKIVNALIAFDAGVLVEPRSVMHWDAEAIPWDPAWPELASWRAPDRPFDEAIADSSVPHFRTLALTIGEARMRAGLARLDYGNQDLGGGLDRFWLSEGALRISAREQLDFVARLAHRTLPVSLQAQSIVRAALVQRDEGRARLFGKTGTGPVEGGEGRFIGWFVGWVERQGESYPFALWVEAATFEGVREKRQGTLEGMLGELGLMGAGGAAWAPEDAGPSLN